MEMVVFFVSMIVLIQNISEGIDPKKSPSIIMLHAKKDESDPDYDALTSPSVVFLGIDEQSAKNGNVDTFIFINS